MNWESRYVAPDTSLWTGRVDNPADSCFYQHVKLQNATIDFPKKHAPLSFALVGFKCDVGAQRDMIRVGSAEAPTVIRQALAKLPIQKPLIEIYDVGDISCDDGNMEASQQALAELVTRLLKEDIRPIIIGGGHEVAWPYYQAIAKNTPPQKRLGIINFDAYFDLHPLASSKLSSTKTTFWQIAEAHKREHREFDYNCIGIQDAGNIRQDFELAKQKKVNTLLADELHQGHQEKSFDFIDRIIDQNDFIYLSLSMNVFSPAFAPGVSNLQPLGLTPWQVLPLLRQVAVSAKVIGYDISEFIPKYDIDQRTAKLVATFIYEIIHHHNEAQLKY